MKLIVEKIAGTVYVYRETERHHKKVARNKRSFSDPKLLDHECDLSSYPDGTIFVFDIK